MFCTKIEITTLFLTKQWYTNNSAPTKFEKLGLFSRPLRGLILIASKDISARTSLIRTGV